MQPQVHYLESPCCSTGIFRIVPRGCVQKSPELSKLLIACCLCSQSSDGHLVKRQLLNRALAIESAMNSVQRREETMKDCVTVTEVYYCAVP